MPNVMPIEACMKTNPIIERIEARLVSFPADLRPLADVCRRYLRHCSAVDSEPDGPIWIAHTPWVGRLAYLITLFSGAKKSWFSKHSAVYGVRIPMELRPVLGCVNGFHAFGLSLYGMVMMRYNQPLDIGTANQYWIHGFQNTDGGFHFGSRHYSDTENAGYFLHSGGRITALLSSGDQVGEWFSFRDFLEQELAASEARECSSVPTDWWH